MAGSDLPPSSISRISAILPSIATFRTSNPITAATWPQTRVFALHDDSSITKGANFSDTFASIGHLAHMPAAPLQPKRSQTKGCINHADWTRFGLIGARLLPERMTLEGARRTGLSVRSRWPPRACGGFSDLLCRRKMDCVGGAYEEIAGTGNDPRTGPPQQSFVDGNEVPQSVLYVLGEAQGQFARVTG